MEYINSKKIFFAGAESINEYQRSRKDRLEKNSESRREDVQDYLTEYALDLHAEVITGIELEDVDLSSCNFKDAKIHNVIFRNANFRGSCFIDASFCNVTFINVLFYESELKQSILVDCIFEDGLISCSNLENIQVANSYMSGVTIVHSDAKAGSFLNKSEFIGCNFHDSSFEQCAFTGSGFVACDFKGSNFHRVNFTACRFEGGNFSFSNLSLARLCSATIVNTVFYRSLFNDVDMSNAVFFDNKFLDMKIDNAINLASVVHESSSLFDIKTLYGSITNSSIPFFVKGGIPERALQAIGFHVNEDVTANMQFMILDGLITSMHVEESGASFSGLLLRGMRSKGLNAWAPRIAELEEVGMPRDYIDESFVFGSGKIIIVLTEETMNSQWIWRSIESSIKQEKAQNVIKLYYVRVVSDEKINDWKLNSVKSNATGLSSRPMQIIEDINKRPMHDFSSWRNKNNFEEKFEKFISDILGFRGATK